MIFLDNNSLVVKKSPFDNVEKIIFHQQNKKISGCRLAIVVNELTKDQLPKPKKIKNDMPLVQISKTQYEDPK